MQEETVTTTQRVGPWLVTYVWNPRISKTGPVRATIEVNYPEGHNSRTLRHSPDVLAGLSTTVFRELHPQSPFTTRPDLALLVDLVKESDHGLTDQYLVRLSALYVALATTSRNPSGEMAELLGKAPSTIKNALVRARKEGLLTTVAHRRGGELTDKAHDLIRGEPRSDRIEVLSNYRAATRAARNRNAESEAP